MALTYRLRILMSFDTKAGRNDAAVFLKNKIENFRDSNVGVIKSAEIGKDSFHVLDVGDVAEGEKVV
jgi:hypothetical protein